MPIRRQPSKIRVFPQHRGLAASQRVMPSGGSLDTTAQEGPKVVDQSITHLDRHRVHLSRRNIESSKIFVPSENAAAKNTSRGLNLHTDPFDADRLRATFRKGKAKIATPRAANVELVPRRCSKHVPAHERNEKPEFICANGLRHTSPKRVTSRSFETTHQLEQKPKGFTGNRRFINSYDKPAARAVSPTGTNSTYNGAVVAPLALQSQPNTSVPASGASTFRSISNAFFDQGQVLSLGYAASATERRKPTIRLTDAKTNPAPTMEGVFSPMRNGRVPRPQPVIAPWARDNAPPPPIGVRMVGTRGGSHTPFAITVA